MSRTFVHAGRRRAFTSPVAHSAGDLVWDKGFYGIVQDNVPSGSLGTLILDAGVQELKNVYGSNLTPGTKVSAIPTITPTTLQIFPAASVPGGANAIGRVWATSPASLATATVKVAIFHPNQY